MPSNHACLEEPAVRSKMLIYILIMHLLSPTTQHGYFLVFYLDLKDTIPIKKFKMQTTTVKLLPGKQIDLETTCPFWRLVFTCEHCLLLLEPT